MRDQLVIDKNKLLKSEIERLKAENVQAADKMQAEIEELKAQNAKLEKEVDDFSSGILERDRKLSELLQEIDRLKSEKKDLENLLDDYRDDVTMLTSKIESLQKQLDAAASYAEGVPVEHDPVNRPAHYSAGGIEVIDYIRAKLSPDEFSGYCKGNVLKYVSRSALKGGSEDLRKAAKYLEFATGEELT